MGAMVELVVPEKRFVTSTSSELCTILSSTFVS